MTIEAFNSQLLSLVQEHYRGPFNQKILTALNTPNWDQDLGKACMAMFRTSSEEIVPPTPEMIARYGQGDIGNDYLINLFFDDRMGRIINAFRSLSKSEGPNFESLRPLVSELSFLDGIQRSSSANEGTKTPLFYMRLIYDAFARIVLRKPMTKITFPVENTEALSFLGISSLLNGFLEKQMSQFFINPSSAQFNLMGIGPYTSAKKPWLKAQRFFPIDRALDNEDFDDNELFSHFADFNNRYIAQSKPDLPISLSNLLSSSSFLWDQQIFGIDPTALQAMSEEQRLQFLLKNKNGIIERCFDYLNEDVGFEQETLKEKFKLLRIGNQIGATLKEIESMRHILNHTVRAKKGTKNSIREISDHFGDVNDTQFEAELLTLLEKSSFEEPVEVSGLERVIFDLANKYRREVLLEASYKEKIAEETEKLKLLREELGAAYVSIGDEYLKIATKNQMNINDLLQVHAVFSYFIFNKDAFPQRAAFSKFAKKSAAKKILHFMKRKRRQEPLPSAVEGENLQGTIQDFLNQRSEEIFQQFKEYQKGGVRALTPEEIQRIATVSRAISENPQDIEKFERFEKVLEKILLEDEAFSKNCQDLSRGISTEKIVKLQTHMNACLLFTEGQMAADATGMERSVGFEKLHKAILKAMEGESIELRALRSGEQILDQLESFGYPPEVLSSFDENISRVYRSIPLDVIRDFELNIQPLNIDNFPQVKQKRLLLEEIKKKIYEKAPIGESTFLSKKHRPPRTWNERTTVPAIDSIRNLFSGERNTYTRKYLLDKFKYSSFYYGTLIKALQDFASRERINIDILTPGVIRQNLGYLLQNEIDLAILIGIHEEIRKDYMAQIANLERLHITQLVRTQSAGSQETRASVFDNTTLFRYYKEQSENFAQNQETSEQLYEQFLPLFLTSYLADAANLTYGSSFFVQAKLDAIKKILPGVDRVYGELDAFFISKGRQLARLQDFFREQQNQSSFLEPSFLEKLKSMINDIVTGPLVMIGESALVSAVVGIGILSYTGSPYLAAIGGMAISAFWMTQGKVFVKDIFSLAKETIQYLFGSGYSASSINDYILDLFKVAFKTEVKLSQSDRQGELELQHLFSNAIFLQEEFSILRNSRYSLLEFKNRLHMLLPNALENANFSTMLLNLFFKFNEPLFLSAPPKLLKNAQNPLFHQSIKEYFLTYDQMINEEKQKFLQSGHHEEECDLTIGAHSPFKDFLLDKIRSGNLSLSFPRNSAVHQFLNAQFANLENFLYMPLEEGQIIPIGTMPNNLKAFVRTLNEGLSISDQFLGAISPVLLRSQRIMTPSAAHLDAFDQGLKTSYFLVRYAFDTARRLQNFSSSGILSSPADSWLSCTNETGPSIFLSPLFRESFSLLMRTAELAASTGIPEGQSALRIMSYIQGVVDAYLKRGTINIIPLERFEELENAIVGLLAKGIENPQIIFPIIIERERNQNIELPFTVWSFGQQALAEEMGRNDSAVALRNANSSNITYLSNQSLELFFTSASSRGFALSPMVMNILEEALHHQNSQGILQFLGIMNERDKARLSSMQQPERFLPNLEEMRQAISRNMARRQGQPLALMPPQSQRAQEGFGIPQQATGTEPLVNPTEPMMQGYPEQSVQSPSQMQPMGGSVLPVGQEVAQPSAQPMNPQAQNMQGTPSTQTPVPQRQSQEPSQGMTYMPMMMPGMQGQTGVPQQVPEEAIQQPIPEQEQAISEAENRNMVMVGSDGRSGTYSVGASGGGQGDPPNEVENAYQRLADRGERYAQMPSRDVPPIGPAPNRPYRGPMNMRDFENYQEEINQPQGFPYGKAAAIGGGLMIGAALLSQMMKKDEKKRKKP